MKVCNAEAMKKVKSLEDDILTLRYNENMNSTVSYKEGETKTEVNYDYKATRKSIEKLNAEIRRIKNALSVANSTYVIDGFGITIGEALVYLAQLNREREIVSELANRNKLSRRITSNGVIEYTECTYDPEQAHKDQKALYEKISKLQVAIDRANLTCMIEI